MAMPAVLPISFAGVELNLLADRAIHWPARDTLIVADVHLGKDASFRMAGLAVPAGNSAKDLGRLSTLLAATGAKRLVVLGDLVHNRSSHQAELATAFSAWRDLQADLEVLLIRGNHDRHAGATPENWRIQTVNEPFEDGPLTLAHYAQPMGRPHLCGHLHPVVSVRDFDRSAVSLPCFVIDPACLTLPAFGSFTGGLKMERLPDRRIVAATGSSVVAVR